MRISLANCRVGRTTRAAENREACKSKIRALHRSDRLKYRNAYEATSYLVGFFVGEYGAWTLAIDSLVDLFWASDFGLSLNGFKKPPIVFAACVPLMPAHWHTQSGLKDTDRAEPRDLNVPKARTLPQWGTP